MKNNISRTKFSFLNAISAIILTLVNGLFGIIVTRFVIGHFGSDFSGLNSTANQIINVLLILEGGFTLASNVALFKPISQGDYYTSNRILSATRKKFIKIGLLFFLVGTIVSFIYSLLAKTNLSSEFVFSVIFMAVVPQAFNLLYTTTYRVLLQTQQKEYIINCFSSITIGLGHITNIILILHNCQMWMVRFVTMMFTILNCLLITGYTKYKNRNIDFSVPASHELIKGTNDVLAQKITGVVYTSWPIVFLSISQSGGTILSSVYAVYNNVFVMLKALLHGVIDAPRLSFGQMLSEKKKEDVWPVFKVYEFVTVFITFIMMNTACGLILPFVKLYTREIADIDYYDVTIAVFMVIIGTVEMLHIPSGHIINMSGNFKISKKFQVIACILLILSMFLFGSLWGVYGMLSSLLMVAILLAFLEVGYVHNVFFKGKVHEFLFLILPFVITGILFSIGEMNLICEVDNIIKFIIFGFIYLISNSFIALLIGLIFHRGETKYLFSKARSLAIRLKF